MAERARMSWLSKLYSMIVLQAAVRGAGFEIERYDGQYMAVLCTGHGEMIQINRIASKAIEIQKRLGYLDEKLLFKEVRATDETDGYPLGVISVELDQREVTVQVL